MSERKVLNKYYSPDFDPSKVPRVKRKNKQSDVRIMAPFNLKCNTCGNYIANATKFNAKKETVEGETFNGLLIFRFYIKCPRCMATIIFRTNLKDQGYEVEYGATENFMALKMAEKQAKEEAEAEEEEEKINPMKHLENRTKASRLQMEASEQIQSIRSINYRYRTVNLDALIQDKKREATEKNNSELEAKDAEIRLEVEELLNKRKAVDSTGQSTSCGGSSSLNRLIKPQSSNSKFTSSLSSLKKKIKVVPKLSKAEPKINKDQRET